MVLKDTGSNKFNVSLISTVAGQRWLVDWIGRDASVVFKAGQMNSCSNVLALRCTALVCKDSVLTSGAWFAQVHGLALGYLTAALY